MVDSPKLQVGPIQIFCCSEQELLNEICERTVARRGCIITYAHLHTLALANEHKGFAEMINNCDICYCDGMGVSCISRLITGHWISKVTANNFIDALAEIASIIKLRTAIIGSHPETIYTVKSYFSQRGVLIVYTKDGYFDIARCDTVCQELVEIEPDLILIGMGQDRQESFALSLKDLLPRTVLFCVGGLFSVIAGEEWRCPKWMRKIGLEWTFRFASYPNRLWRRYLLEGPRLLLRAAVRGKL